MVRKPKKHRPTAWKFRLSVPDHSPRSSLAITNLEHMCSSYLRDGYEVRIALAPERPMIGSASDVRMRLKWLAVSGSKIANDMQNSDVINVPSIGRA